MGASKSKLRLVVEFDSRRVDLGLEDGASLVLGRSSDSDLRIEDLSVSAKHLKITYAENHVVLEDLDSSNGSFRMPTEAPFVKSSFQPEEENVELRLGENIVVKFSWSQDLIENSDITKTQAEVSDTELLSKVEAEVAEAKKPSSENELNEQKSPQNEKPSVFETYGRAFILLCYSAIALSVSNFLWSRHLGFADRLEKSQQGQGVGLDIIAIYIEQMNRGPWLYIAATLVFSVLFYVFWVRKTKVLKYKMVYIVWGFLVSVFPLSFPVVLAYRNGVSVSQVRSVLKAKELLDSRILNVEEKAQEISKFQSDLKGSSYFYAQAVRFFFNKSIEECGGAWEDSWNKKRLCLVLLNSVSVEALKELEPKVLYPIALRLVLITSLDSIIRVYSVDSTDEDLLNLFVKSVRVVGLEQEAQKIEDIISSTESEDQEKLNALSALKQTIEWRLRSLHTELKIPNEMKVEAPDTLVLGI